jgi:predicted ArsR family transcriptional regulator
MNDSKREGLRRAIVEVIRNHGELTVRQVAEILGKDVKWISPRVTELSQAGRILRVRDCAGSVGRPAAVYRLKEMAEPNPT